MSHGDLVVWNDKVGIIINRENTCQIYVPKEKKYYVPSKEDKIIRVISDKTVIGDYLCMYGLKLGVNGVKRGSIPDGNTYYYIAMASDGSLKVESTIACNQKEEDRNRTYDGNYFYSESDAGEVLEEIKKLLLNYGIC